MDIQSLAKDPRPHDLRLPAWGPYSKKYAGISHLPDLDSGLRFDLSVFPGFYRRQVLVPNARWESGFHPWEAAPDLSYYAYRFELEWKDQVYCDVSFSAMGPDARLVRCEFFNRTALPQNLVLHYMANLNFPNARSYSDEPLRTWRVRLPPGARWIDALDYQDLRFATPRPQDTLVYDGLWRGEVRDHGFVNGSGIGLGFGQEPGDWVEYKITTREAIDDALLLLRYRAPLQGASFRLKGVAGSILELPQAEAFAVQQIWLGDLPAGEHLLRMTAWAGPAALTEAEGAGHGGPVELDGFVLTPQAQVGEVHFEPVEQRYVPEITPGPMASSLLLRYPDVEQTYGLAWLGEPWEIRELYTDELDSFLRYYVHEHVRRTLYGNGQGHFSNVFIRPIEVPPGESRTLYGLACSGSREQVEQAIHAFERQEPEHPAAARSTEGMGFRPPRRTRALDAPGSSEVEAGQEAARIAARNAALEKAYQGARAGLVRLEATPAGETYRFSQEKMAATILTNVVYPIYTRRSYIRHSCPGKWWDCLYTWDSGFIGLGLLEIDIERAIENLNAYTTSPGDPQAAFLHHGSMVPVQHYLFLELWNRTQDRALLEYFYPRLRQYYRFFAGRLGSSTTRMKSNLLKTWDYFYNSGGWDDYPPQGHVRREGLQSTVTPVISTSHGIRTAKIMQMAARALGEGQDSTEYQADIDAWTDALNRYAWDGEAGYFSYVVHSPEGAPLGILRHASGQNYDMGLDGASPLFAGICDEEQRRALMERISSPERLWTRLGMCTVDKTAAYYRVDGYWNGAVWFPQQWFFWKALLDQGNDVFAGQIARAALDTWKTEVEASYHCFEHFIVQSGRGAGWHQFGALSSPVLSWYSAYHRPGHLTAGFDTWITRQQFSDHNRRLEAEIENAGGGDHPFVLLAAMQPGSPYQALWNGQPTAARERIPGLVEIFLGFDRCVGKLEVRPVEGAG